MDSQKILILNGASSVENAPGFVALVHRRKSDISVVDQERVIGRGGAERFPLIVRYILTKNKLKAEAVTMIAVIIGPGSFTGLRASIALAAGLGMGTGCPVIGIRRGEALFPELMEQAKGRDIWHVSLARRGRVFIEKSSQSKVIASAIEQLSVPDEPILMAGESAHLLTELWGDRPNIERASLDEADAVMVAKKACQYWDIGKIGNPLYPLYVDMPEAKKPEIKSKLASS